MTEPRPPRISLLFLTALLSFLAGLGIGIFYYHEIMLARVRSERLSSLRLRYEDWHRFAEHIRKSHEGGAGRRAPFPSDTALSLPKPARFPPPGHPRPVPASSISRSAPDESARAPGPASSQTGERTLEPGLLTLQRLGSDGLLANYAIGTTLSNHGPGSEILSPEDIQVEDQNGRRYSAYRASPPLPVAGIPSGATETHQLFYYIPWDSVPKKLVVVSSSGTITKLLERTSEDMP